MADDVKVFVVDDDAAVREGLKALFGVNSLPAQAFASAEEFLHSIGPGTSGCVVADVRMPGMTGLELLRELKQRRVDLPVIVITGHGDVPMAVAALKDGARDFLEKPFDSDVILAAVREALETRTIVHGLEPAEIESLEARFRDLTPRECEVMDLVVTGNPNKVIAHRLGIAVRTVEVHRAHVMEKTGARNLSELVRMTLQLSMATSRG